MEKSWGIVAGYIDRRGDNNQDIYQSSFWASKIEDVRRWIWKHQCFPAYKRVSLEREEAYASRLVALEDQKGDNAKIYFFVGGGHRWNTLKEVDRIKAIH